MKKSIDDFEPLLDYTDIAELAGISVEAIRGYRWKGMLPDPDVQTSSRRPRWKPSTVRAWLENRPGAGARTDLQRKREQAEAGEGSPEEGQPPVAVA
ncbi:helix-turn-helix transcriptional regulator [Candidatus Frankia alpina]|uniref:MarR family transcriptional regulator n=1 Tax=Candidatus Frankia alpina TaxID=2699483 RepID=A0A4V3Z6D1_9ACTN|nr:MarR family transcriptional regulator [Candidatus Frankia alpina]THJ68869.1 MarR family transcriptional regulator [Candidatus Frankia alpina]